VLPPVGRAALLGAGGPRGVAVGAGAPRALGRAAFADDPAQDPSRPPAAGPVFAGGFAFADDGGRAPEWNGLPPACLVLPELALVKQGSEARITVTAVVHPDDDAASVVERLLQRVEELGPAVMPLVDPDPVERTRVASAAPPSHYEQAVGRAVERIRAGELEKVVLARDLVGHVPEGADLRRVLLELALGYPDTWTFAVDGHLGSSPETLIRVHDGDVTARVLAGSHARGADAEADAAAALELATSAKDLDEHRFAVESVLRALRPHGPGITSTELPFTLKLPNLWHLASDVHGRLSDGSGALDLVAALHPTAAVAGTPTRSALEVIRELEPFDRGRYGGPVGWVDQAGDGKWAISLRSAEVDADGTLTAYAGAGIVAESDPDRELAETKLKFRPIVEAFG